MKSEIEKQVHCLWTWQYGIIKGSTMGSVLSSIFWLWSIGILISVGCVAAGVLWEERI